VRLFSAILSAHLAPFLSLRIVRPELQKIAVFQPASTAEIGAGLQRKLISSTYLVMLLSSQERFQGSLPRLPPAVDWPLSKKHRNAFFLTLFSPLVWSLGKQKHLPPPQAPEDRRRRCDFVPRRDPPISSFSVVLFSIFPFRVPATSPSCRRILAGR